MTPDLVAGALRRVAAKLDRSETPSLQLVRRDLARIAHNMRTAANGPVSLTTDGEVRHRREVRVLLHGEAGG